MSTTIKRIALVAVAALGLSVVSVAPSQAFTQSDTLTLSSATATQLTGETLTAGSASATLTFLATAAADTMTVSAFLISAPAGNTTLPTLAMSDTANANVANTATGANAAARTVLGQNAFVSSTAATVAVSARFNVYLNGPTLPGTYVVLVSPAVTVTGNGALASTARTLTITVTANPNTDTVAASATSIINIGETISATADQVVTSTRTPALGANNVAAATIKVDLLNAAARAVTAESFTATISGPGVLGAAAYGDGHNSHTIAAQGRSLLAVNGSVIAVFPDGTSGVATITIASAAGRVLATETVTFFGAAATVATVVKKSVIGQPAATIETLEVSVKDSSGVAVSGITRFGVVSSDTTKIATNYSVTPDSYNAVTGTYLVPVTGVAAGSANLVVTTNASATDTTGVSAAAVSVRVGSYVPASVVVTTDKTSYAPGEKATIKVQLLDATGLEVVAGESYTAIFATGGIVSSYQLGSSSATISGTDVNVYAIGGKSYDVFLPVTEGDVKFTWTTGSTASGTRTGLATANQKVAGTRTVEVSSPASAAAIDAANEAASAAQDATDAAIQAADAADEATAAVAALTLEVNTLIAGLKKQLTTLTNLVIRIQKKVRA